MSIRNKTSKLVLQKKLIMFENLKKLLTEKTPILVHMSKFEFCSEMLFVTFPIYDDDDDRILIYNSGYRQFDITPTSLINIYNDRIKIDNNITIQILIVNTNIS